MENPEDFNKKIARPAQLCDQLCDQVAQSCAKCTCEGMEKFNQKFGEKEESPIAKGEVFDPEKEVKEIGKLPHSEKHAKITEFREKSAFQKEGIGELQEVLEKAIRQNPDAPLAKLCESVELMAPQWGLTNWQKELAKRALTKYVEKHNAVRLAREKYPDDKELYEALFGRKPKGKLGVSLGPMTIRFHIKNIEDFTYVYKQIFLEEKRHITKKNIKESLSVWGFLIHNVFVPELDSTVIFINCYKNRFSSGQETRSTIEHEERHAIDFLLKDVLFFNEDEDKREEALFDEIGYSFLHKKEKDVEIALLRFFIEARKLFENHAQVEVVAYFSEGYLRETIINKLTEKNGAYDYYGIIKKLAKKDEDLFKFNTGFFIESLGVEFAPMIKKIAKQVFVEDYHKLLEESVDAMFDLQIEGYSNEKIVGLLSMEPLRKWRKVVDRLLAAENMKEETE